MLGADVVGDVVLGDVVLGALAASVLGGVEPALTLAACSVPFMSWYRTVTGAPVFRSAGLLVSASVMKVIWVPSDARMTIWVPLTDTTVPEAVFSVWATAGAATARAAMMATAKTRERFIGLPPSYVRQCRNFDSSVAQWSGDGLRSKSGARATVHRVDRDPRHAGRLRRIEWPRRPL